MCERRKRRGLTPAALVLIIILVTCMRSGGDNAENTRPRPGEADTERHRRQSSAGSQAGATPRSVKHSLAFRLCKSSIWMCRRLGVPILCGYLKVMCGAADLENSGEHAILCGARGTSCFTDSLDCDTKEKCLKVVADCGALAGVNLPQHCDCMDPERTLRRGGYRRHGERRTALCGTPDLPTQPPVPTSARTLAPAPPACPREGLPTECWYCSPSGKSMEDCSFVELNPGKYEGWTRDQVSFCSCQPIGCRTGRCVASGCSGVKLDNRCSDYNYTLSP
jgi:hypothetical protein